MSCSRAEPIASIRKSILRLELESWKKLEGKNLEDEVLLVGKLEVVWSSQVWAAVMYPCTRHLSYLDARQDLGNSEPWIQQMHRKITDLTTMIVTYIQNKNKVCLPTSLFRLVIHIFIENKC